MESVYISKNHGSDIQGLAIILEIPKDPIIDEYYEKINNLLTLPLLFTAVITEQFLADEYDRALLHEGLITCVTQTNSRYRYTEKGFVEHKKGQSYQQYVREKQFDAMMLENAIERANGKKVDPIKADVNGRLNLVTLMEKAYNCVFDSIRNNQFAFHLLTNQAMKFQNVTLVPVTTPNCIGVRFVGVKNEEK